MCGPTCGGRAHTQMCRCSVDLHPSGDASACSKLRLGRGAGAVWQGGVLADVANVECFPDPASAPAVPSKKATPVGKSSLGGLPGVRSVGNGGGSVPAAAEAPAEEAGGAGPVVQTLELGAGLTEEREFTICSLRTI